MAILAPLLLATAALAHGGHGHDADDPHAAAANDDSLGYAQRHVSDHHHRSCPLTADDVRAPHRPV